MADESRLLNWQRVCQLLGCKRAYFYVLVNSGALPSVRLGNRCGIRVRESDVRAYLKKRKKYADNS
jgi:excisionase family DNA binding protein